MADVQSRIASLIAMLKKGLSMQADRSLFIYCNQIMLKPSILV